MTVALGRAQASTPVSQCRLCGGRLGPSVLSLGAQPISNRLQSATARERDAEVYPLELALCSSCGLAQLAHHIDAAEHFHADYVYVSGASSTWIAHCRDYADDLMRSHGVGQGDLIVEVGSNDGTLLSEFKKRGCAVLGVEPSRNVAEIARAAGIDTEVAFFNPDTAARLARAHGPVRCVIGNNVLAHVPETDAFLQAARHLAGPDGFLCFEFPHAIRLVSGRYFDMIYHEHYSYLGVGPLQRWAQRHGMMIFEVSEQPTHGGSLRLFLRRDDGSPLPARVRELIAAEEPYAGPAPWREFAEWLRAWRADFVGLVQERKRAGRRIAGYAAAAKATVMCNFLGLDAQALEYCCDASPLKQGKLIPGTGIPIVAPRALRERPVDTVIVFAWNIFDELVDVIETLVDDPVEIVRPLPQLAIHRCAPR